VGPTPVLSHPCRPLSELGLNRVIPAIPACPVRPKSGHSANARVCEWTAYGAVENRSLLESKSVGRAAQLVPGVRSALAGCLLGQHARGVVSFPLRTSHGRGA
jgi:hypothetical protein